MAKEPIKYPDARIKLISGNVRHFDETLQEYVDAMIETMKEYDFSALSAIQIGIQYNIIVLKENDEYTPYINGRIIKQKGKKTYTERCYYYPNMSVDVERYESLTFIYEDMEGNPHSRDVTGELARVIQHQLDYCFGSTFVDRVDKETKKRINEHLEFGLVKDSHEIGSCPTVFYRDYFTKAIRIILLLTALSFVSIFFSLETERFTEIYLYQSLALALVLLLTVGYAVVAFWESKRYKSCTSCQTGNIIGTSGIILSKVAVLALLSYLLIKP